MENGRMMNEYKKVRLGDVCEINMGQSPDSSSYNTDKNGIPFFQGNADFGEVFPSVRTWCTKPTKIASSGDLLISVRAPIGALNFANMSCCIGRGLAAVRTGKTIDTKYLWFILKNSKDFLNSKGTGSTFKAISKNVLTNLEIPLPPLATQKQIAATLDKVTKIIAENKTLLEKYDLLIKSRFIEMFGDPVENPMGWDTVKIVDLCNSNDDIKCGPFGTQLSKDEYVKSGIPVFGIPQINSFFKIKPTEYLTEEKANKLSSYSLVKGDIAMSRKGNVGKCALYLENEKGIIHSDVVRLRVAPNISNPTYLMNQLHISPRVGTQIANVSHGAIMAGINVTKLKNIVVYNPPLELQQQFAAFVQQIDKSKIAVQKSLEKCETLYKSLMQEYFG